MAARGIFVLTVFALLVWFCCFLCFLSKKKKEYAHPFVKSRVCEGKLRRHSQIVWQSQVHGFTWCWRQGCCLNTVWLCEVFLWHGCLKTHTRVVTLNTNTDGICAIYFGLKPVISARTQVFGKGPTAPVIRLHQRCQRKGEYFMLSSPPRWSNG